MREIDFEGNLLFSIRAIRVFSFVMALVAVAKALLNVLIVLGSLPENAKGIALASGYFTFMSISFLAGFIAMALQAIRQWLQALEHEAAGRLEETVNETPRQIFSQRF